MRRLILCVLCVTVLGKSTLKPEAVTTQGKSTLRPETVTAQSKSTLKPKTDSTVNKCTLKPVTDTTVGETTTLENVVTTGTVKPKKMSKLEKMFRANKIIPEVITVAPEKILEIEYIDIQENKTYDVTPGNILNSNMTKAAPFLSWSGSNPEIQYTYCVVDPDYRIHAVRPREKEFVHMLVVNMNGTDKTTGNILFDYVGPVPVNGSGLHRYVHLVYQQSSRIYHFEPEVITYKSGNDRKRFSIDEFAKKHDLGNPIAGNFFRAEYDDFVPTWEKYLGLRYKTITML